VVLWKPDRLGPRLRDAVATLADWGARGLKVVIIALRLELDGDVGRPLAALLVGLAEVEREFHQRRQAAGIADAKRRGAYKGRARGTTKGDPSRVRELRGKGLTVTEIAHATGVSERTVTRYLAGGEEAGERPSG
jgi:DNA invertase Pin-like site-specific DNA recombinase